ncbi:putative small auxin-up RNA [Dioscorea sansibarensis]
MTEMENNSKNSKSLISKTFQRCRSFGSKQTRTTPAMILKTRSLSESPKKKKKVAPEGCVSVYVGQENKRFFVRTEVINHHLFKKLLDDAERVYGFATEGPLKLPCNVELFQEVLWEMETEKEMVLTPSLACSFSRSSSGYHLVSPSRPMAMHG